MDGLWPWALAVGLAGWLPQPESVEQAVRRRRFQARSWQPQWKLPPGSIRGGAVFLALQGPHREETSLSHNAAHPAKRPAALAHTAKHAQTMPPGGLPGPGARLEPGLLDQVRRWEVPAGRQQLGPASKAGSLHPRLVCSSHYRRPPCFSCSARPIHARQLSWETGDGQAGGERI